jgi:hypothetical protein
VREVRGIEREDREEPITNNNRLIEREVGGLGEKLVTPPLAQPSQRRRLATRLERLGVEAPPQRLGTPCRL